MNIIKRHKGLAIIGSLTLVLLVIIFIIVGRMFFNENNSTYGDRLNNIIPVDKSIKNKIKEEYAKKDEVEEISTRTQGKIIYTTIKFKEGTKIAKAKELALGIIDYYGDDIKKAYDFGFFLIENIKSSGDKKGFIVSGNKHPDNKTISWTE